MLTIKKRWALFIAADAVLLGSILFFLLTREAEPKVSPKDEEGFERLGPAQPGEWRHRFKEPLQTFESYSGGLVNRKSAQRSTFYLQPLGEAGDHYREILDRMRVYAEAFFGVPAKILPPIPLLESAFAPERNQYNASRLIGHLADRVPADALIYVGIADRDLYSEGLNFVFGEGSLHQRSGVYSLVRHGDPAQLARFTRRSLDLLAHESGHILSIEHCVTYKCVMQGANTLLESDSHPMHLCPIDLEKVLWNTGMDRMDRYRKLLALYRQWELGPEAAWVQARLDSH